MAIGLRSHAPAHPDPFAPLLRQTFHTLAILAGVLSLLALVCAALYMYAP